MIHFFQQIHIPPHSPTCTESHRLYGGEIMSYRLEQIEKAFAQALPISAENHRKIVLMSDCHRGNGSWTDSFLPNRPIYTAALKYYLQKQFTYIELGDGDELWENRRFLDIYRTHREVFYLFQQFYAEGRLFLLWGNHDRIKENAVDFWKGTPFRFPFYQSIRIKSGNSPDLFLLHGHQGDLINDTLWKVSRSLVRHLWRPLELRGVKDPTSAAKNYTKKRKIEEEFIDYSCKQHCILVAGHTHKPTLTKTDCGLYFNCGSCVHPGAITAIEIDTKTAKATLVKWSICSNKDMSLYVCRERLKELPMQL